MKITALLRERNEALLLKDTLDHLATFAKEIIVFDDASTDDSARIAQEYPAVRKVIRNFFWRAYQRYAQTVQRKLLLEWAKQNCENEWVVYVDCDERLEFDWNKLDEYDKQGYVGVKFKLFDAYMTPDDCKPYEGQPLQDFRKWFGPAYREIAFAFKKSAVWYPTCQPGTREPFLYGEVAHDGYVQHYGKAMSVEQWEKTCTYYENSMPELAAKWAARHGKAIHDKVTDFGNPLMSWSEAKEKGFPLANDNSPIPNTQRVTVAPRLS